jgi:hypothetical protein
MTQVFFCLIQPVSISIRHYALLLFAFQYIGAWRFPASKNLRQRQSQPFTGNTISFQASPYTATSVAQEPAGKKRSRPYSRRRKTPFAVEFL